MSSRTPRIWRQLHWTRPLDVTRLAACLRHWATDNSGRPLTLEARATNGQVTYWLEMPAASTRQVTTPLRDAGASVHTTEEARQPVRLAARVTLSTRHRSLRVDTPEVIVRALLAALTQARGDELLVLQVMLGPGRIPLAVPNHSTASTVAPWWQTAWHGDGGRIDGERRAALRAKVADHGFACTIRLGAAAVTPARRRSLLSGVIGALRTSEAPGVLLRVQPERPARLNGARRPWRWPLRLSVPELLTLTGWPLGGDELPGVAGLHPRPLPPVPGTTGPGRVVADSTMPGIKEQLTLSAENALHHVHVLGPTGTGKSNLVASMAIQDIRAGRSVVVVEPKGDLVEDILARMPEARRGDVVNLDPSDDTPTGLNPLATHGRRPELVADAMLAVFKQLFGAAVGPRSQDILYASFLTLARRGDASLVMLPLLLTNPGVRRSITQRVRDPLFLDPFWATFESWSEAERVAAVAPVLNKVRVFLRPGLRAVLGQRQPKFDLREVFTGKKILLVPLRRGVLGSEAAKLLGSIVVSELWMAAQARSAVPVAQRHPVMVYIDEFQDYVHLPTDLGEAMAQARGYGVSFALGHQLMQQLPREMRSALLANCRSRVVFQLPHEDAVLLAKGHNELEAADLVALGRYEVYASLYANGKVNPYASGVTLTLSKPTSDPDELRQLSRERYGQPLSQVEAGFAELVDAADSDLGVTGRRWRQP